MPTEAPGISYCVSLHIRGALKAFSRRELESLFVQSSGETLSADEAVDHMLDLVAKGHRFVAMGRCDNFDPDTGCKGHASMPAEEAGPIKHCA